MPLDSQPLTAKLGVADVRSGYQRLASLEELPVKGRVKHVGYVQSVGYSAPGSAPLLTAVVVDRLGGRGRPAAAAHVRLKFMGQKKVPGIAPGVKVKYSGMVAPVDQVPTIFNPRYVIVPESRQ